MIPVLLDSRNGVRLEYLERNYYRVRVPNTTWTVRHDYYYDSGSLARIDFAELANLAGMGPESQRKLIADAAEATDLFSDDELETYALKLTKERKGN